VAALSEQNISQASYFEKSLFRINSLASSRFRGFLRKKTPKRLGLCVGISPVK